MKDINEQLFRDKFRETPSCWVWTAGTSYDGYGRFAVERKPEYAHRVAWLLWVGGIPEKRVISHTCRNKLCVNPAHLKAITVKTSVNQSDRAKRRNLEYCNRGHKLTADNTYVHPRRGGSGRPSFECLTCRRDKDRERNLSKRK